MFSLICQWSISTQVLGSREKKRLLPGSEVDGGAEAMLVDLRQWQFVMSCWSYSFSNLDASCSCLPSTGWNFSLHTKQLYGAGEIPHLLTISGYLPKRKLLSKETSPRDLEMLCRTCLTDTLLVSPEIYDYILVSSQFEQTQEKPESSGAALSKQPWPACLPNMF